MLDFRRICGKLLPAVHIVFIIIWLSNLTSTDAYFSVYALIAFLSFYLKVRKPAVSVPERRGGRLFMLLLSVIFSAAVVLANYPIFTTLGDPAVIGRATSIMVNLINTVFSLFGGVCVFYTVVSHFFSHFPMDCVPDEKFREKNYFPVFIFASFVAINLIHLFLVEYPGNVTEDPFTQISEMVSGQYSNFNTFWHTMIFQGILSLGYGLFSDVNAAVAVFCVVQILVMAFAFTYCLMTMVHYGVPRAALIITYLIFAFLPYHIALSITIWKDVLYAAGSLLMLAAWLRILKKIGTNSLWNYGVFVFGSLLFLLSRTNGWIIYLVTFLLFALFVRRDKKLIAVMGTMAVLGWLLLNPVLTVLNIPGGDVTESLSIPIQQVSRVITEGRELTEEEEALLSRIVDLEEVPGLYTNWLSDPMKVEVRSKDQAYFEEHLGDYARLWVRLGLRYPVEYLKAWVDQTKGYWNGGYGYAMYSETITDNPYGVGKTGGGNPVASLFRLYFGLSRHVIFFEPLHSIGLHVWIMILCFLLNVRKKREEWVISVPLLLLVVGLWFGTPVYCSFRYVYPLFASFPLIVSTTIYEQKEK